MVTFQVSGPRNRGAVRFGSFDVYLGDDEATATRVGMLQGDSKIKIEEEPRRFKPANAPEQNYGMASQLATVSLNLYEQDFQIIASARKGIDYISTVSAGATTVTDELHTAVGTQPIYTNFYNLDKTKVSSIVVKKASDNSTITATGNYQTGVDARGYSFVLPLDGGAITDGMALKISYSYNKANAVVWGTGGLSNIQSRYMKLVNTDDAGKQLKIEIWSATHDGGLEFTFGGDDTAEPGVLPLTMRCVPVTSKTAGTQLIQITDEQGVFQSPAS